MTFVTTGYPSTISIAPCSRVRQILLQRNRISPSQKIMRAYDAHPHGIRRVRKTFANPSSPHPATKPCGKVLRKTRRTFSKTFSSNLVVRSSRLATLLSVFQIALRQFHWRSAPLQYRPTGSLLPQHPVGPHHVQPKKRPEALASGHSTLSVEKPVGPFVLRMCPAPPVARRRRCDCLATTPPTERIFAWSLLLRPHSPTAAFQSPRRPSPGTGNQSGGHSGSCVSSMLLCQVHVASGLIGPRSVGRMSGRQARHTFRTLQLRSISDSRKQKLCLTDRPTDFTGKRL